MGDPLSGTLAPPIRMPNGSTYHLQELAFFSWFYGAPSVGVNGWFSDNGDLLVGRRSALPINTFLGTSSRTRGRLLRSPHFRFEQVISGHLTELNGKYSM